MRLIILTQYFPPEIGAPQARLSELAARFVRRGHSVTVLTAMPNYPIGKIHPGYRGLWRRERQDGMRVIRSFIYPTQKASFAHRMTNYLSFVFSSSLTGSLFLDRADYLLVESPPLFLGLSGLWLSRLERARLIFNVSDLWPESAVRLGILRPGSLPFKVSAWLEKVCYRSAWLVTGQSKTILADISARFPGCRTFHLSNGVDTRTFRPGQRSEQARALLDGRGEPVALYAGLHGLAQGLEQLLEAAVVLRDGARVSFVLVGDGPEKKSLVKRAAGYDLDNVRFLEARPAAEVPALVASADIAVVPLKTYIPGAVPSKLYEAMASGRPVLLIAEGEAADIVEEHRAGLVVKPGDIKGLVQAMRALSENPSLRRTLGENGRRAAERFFDRDRIAERFIAHLEENL